VSAWGRVRLEASDLSVNTSSAAWLRLLPDRPMPRDPVVRIPPRLNLRSCSPSNTIKGRPYADLLDRLGVWRSESGQRVALVTLNYDELLDKSAEGQVGSWQLTDFSAYLERPDWHLFKLHGSVGWSRVLDGWQGVDSHEPNDVIAHSGGRDFDNGELRAMPWADSTDASDGCVAAPGIAVPTTLKQSFQCPREHVAAFGSDAAEVSRLLLVGWRAAEPHVVEVLASRLQPGIQLAVCDVGAQDYGAIESNLGIVARRCREPAFFPGGFSGMLQGEQLEQWLRRPAFSDRSEE
jgi:hypothetical protein